MKIAIFTEGNKNVGFGHITRCLAIYQQAIMSKDSCKMFLFIDNSIQLLLSDINYEKIDWINSLNRIKNTIKEFDIAIIDSYLANLDIYEKISSLVQVGVYIDDYNRIEYPDGVILNWQINAEQIAYSYKNYEKALLGPSYTVFRKPFWTLNPRKIDGVASHLLITFGGSDIRNLTPIVLETIVEHNPNLQISVIIGPGFINIKQIELIANKSEKIKIFYNLSAESMKKLMVEIDLAISACGQTLYELAASGVPTIGITIVENQLNNVKSWMESGFLLHAGWWENEEWLEPLIKDIDILINNPRKRNEMSQQGQNLVNPQGTFLMLQKIRKLLLNKN